MTGQLVLEVAPQALNQVELRRLGGQKERLELVGMGAPPLLHGMALVVARSIEHDQERLVSGEGVGQRVEEGHGGRAERRLHPCAR